MDTEQRQLRTTVLGGGLVLVSFLVFGSIVDAAEIPTRQVREKGFLTGAWVVEKQWDQEAEKEYAAFVEAIGTAREKKGFRLYEGLRDPAVNPLYTEEDKDFEVEVDCANLPYLLRVYFSYKTRRPYSFQANKCRRYKEGNQPTEFRDFSQYPDFPRLARAALSAVSSGHYRMHATIEGSDMYPIDPTVDTLLPGNVFYDPNGHVLQVYKVDRDRGEIFMLDGHPDGTMSRKMFGESYARGSARFGGGFKAWRHYHVDVLDREKGSFVITREPNARAFGYSAVAQYQTEYWEDGLDMTYHEWIRARVSQNGIYVDPEDTFGRMLASYCGDVQDRVKSVDSARRNGIAAKPHPNALPWNIYGASGEWENYSSPGRDTRLRFKTRELTGFLKRTMGWARTGDRRLRFTGGPELLQEVYNRVWTEKSGSEECSFAYTNSKGEKVEFTLTDVMDRLYALSFDPYHCPELRWGALQKGPDGEVSAEFATCPADRRKLWWYEREQRLRNRLTRLLRQGTMIHRGPEVGEDHHLGRLLRCYQERQADFLACHPEEADGSLDKATEPAR